MLVRRPRRHIDLAEDKTTGEKRHKVYVTARSIDFLERRIDQAALSANVDPLGAGVEPF